MRQSPLNSLSTDVQALEAFLDTQRFFVLANYFRETWSVPNAQLPPTVPTPFIVRQHGSAQRNWLLH